MRPGFFGNLEDCWFGRLPGPELQPIYISPNIQAHNQRRAVQQRRLRYPRLRFRRPRDSQMLVPRIRTLGPVRSIR
jgi:hypothetical protein